MPVAGKGAFQNHAPKAKKIKQVEIKEDLMIALQHSLSTLETGGMNIEAINARLAPTYVSLPKLEHGKLENLAARYLAHGFFRKEYGWLIHGLDPAAETKEKVQYRNVTSLPNSKHDVVEFLLGILGRKLDNKGLSLNAAVAFVALLGNLILHDGVDMLQDAYALNNFGVDSHLTEKELHRVLDSYMVLLSSDKQHGALDMKQHNVDRANIHNAWEGFPVMQTFSGDMLKNTAFMVEGVKNPFEKRTYTFQDARRIIVGMSQQYGKVRNIQCTELKEGLTEMDPWATGRVSLRHFYTRRAVGPWQLVESKQYLRQLGALDESMPELGPRVIIPNYVTAVSNCDSPSDYYSICCIHECDDLLNQLEVDIKAPDAKPQDILHLVQNMTSGTIDAPRNLSKVLVHALDQVAAIHDGRVPLHSRLFAQWMHYVFPHECPYPYMKGAIKSLSPHEWQEQTGRDIAATDSEIQEIMQMSVSHGEAFDMAQWTLEEEMLTSKTEEGHQEANKDAWFYFKTAMQLVAFAGGPAFFLMLVASSLSAFWGKKKGVVCPLNDLKESRERV